MQGVNPFWMEQASNYKTTMKWKKQYLVQEVRMHRPEPKLVCSVQGLTTSATSQSVPLCKGREESVVLPLIVLPPNNYLAPII